MVEEDLDPLGKAILEIAIEIGAKKKTINLGDLFRIASSRLNYPENEIRRTIVLLYKKVYIIEGTKFTKFNILKNIKRQQVYEYIKNNPELDLRSRAQCVNFALRKLFSEK